MGTAYQHLVGLLTSDADPSKHTPEQMTNAIKACTQFLNDTQLRLESVAEARRVETILDTAMSTLAVLDRDTSRPLPDNLTFPPRDLAPLRSCRELSDFQRVFLWELAVIGQPVVVEVLARSPLVIKFSRSFAPATPWKSDPRKPLAEWIEIVRHCVLLLEERCLVFGIRPRAPGDDGEIRYTVHSQLQLHVFRPMYAPFVEYPEADQFALTLFASQPNDVPRLTAQARRDLHRTVAALIHCPQADTGSDGLPFPAWPDLLEEEPPDSQRATLTIRAQMLRAALGILRSVYSLSTIVRSLSERSPGIHASQHLHSPMGERRRQQRSDEPLLEQHRFLILWLIRQCAYHDRQVAAWKLRNPTKPHELEPAPLQKPFYSEEIAWLYNEAGVLSYTQGRMLDAKTFFARATTAAGRIEPEETGAIRTRIALNCAMADIERGRLTLAEPALITISRIEDEHPALLRLAAGLLGLVNHIRGRYPTAEKHYKEALNDDSREKHLGLVSLQRTRAASIISRYYGDMLRVQGRFEKAGRLLRQSATLAIEGGHEDIRHQARLAALNLELAEAGVGRQPHPTVDGSRIHKELDVIEDYAYHMGMPRLQCEIDLIRALLRQTDGDLQAAAAVASRGLTVASANELRLRKTRFLLRLAEIFERRGKIRECTTVLAEAFNIARESEYHSAREQGQALYARITGHRGATENLS
jgi:tetratricopeptide (TPR) repeat protein